MKKFLRIILMFLLSLTIFGLSKCVKANSINKISMDIYISNNGDATVTEVWECSTNKGTEVYHPYYNLGKSQIKDLVVSDNGNNYQTLSKWNTSGTLESKANKCGINKISNGIEICWGISKYGSHKYTVRYTITNFVADLTDAQMVYWTLIPKEFSNTIGNAYIKIHTTSDIPNTVGVWGYGNYGGTAYVYDGYIEMQSKSSLDKNEYMTILVKFPKNTFNTANSINHDFDYYYNMAEKGSTKYNKKSSSNEINFFKIIGTFLNSLIPLGIFGIIFFSSMRKTIDNKELKLGKNGKIKQKDVEYYRDIPCKKDLFRAYYIGYNYGILKKKTDLLGAIILKWLRESFIRIEKRETGKVFKKEDTVLILNEVNPEKITDILEKEMFEMLYEASKDGVLESKEFEKWANRKYEKLLKWFDRVLEDQKYKLVYEGLINCKEKTRLKIFKTKEYIATPELRQEAVELAGLKKYLKEYTLIKDREAIEVSLFEEYLMYAQLMGIAKEVAKEFKDLYPEIIEQSSFNNYDNIILVNMWAANGVSYARTAQARAESYSSGGGGFSSGGGGGGSFGGGGGGGGFR